MPHVELLKLQADGQQQVIVTCVLRGEMVECSGDQSLVISLQEDGIIDYRSQKKDNLFPKDGMIFLQQLKYNFSSGYLNATDVLEEEPQSLQTPTA